MINEYIVILRRYCNINASVMAQCAKMPLSRYQKFEDGEYIPNKRELYLIANALGLKPSFLEDLKNNKLSWPYLLMDREPDNNMFESEEMKNRYKIFVNMLSTDELRLVLFYRNANTKNKDLIYKLAETSIISPGSGTERIVEEFVAQKLAEIEPQDLRLVAQKITSAPTKQDTADEIEYAEKFIEQSQRLDEFLKDELEDIIDRKIRELIS